MNECEKWSINHIDVMYLGIRRLCHDVDNSFLLILIVVHAESSFSLGLDFFTLGKIGRLQLKVLYFIFILLQ